MLPADDPTSLALLYHLNSQPWIREDDDAGVDQPYEVEYKQLASHDHLVRLPSGAGRPVLADLLVQRRSCREYRMRSMPIDTLSSLLLSTYALNQQREPLGDANALPRTVPSAGALYPLELYVVTERVLEVSDGLYHYNVLDHGLEPVRSGTLLRMLANILLGQDDIVNANVVLILSGVFRRTLRKYGPRGYRYVLLEAGHAAQNCCLMAIEQGLGSFCMGGFYDSRLNRFLGLDGITEAAVYCVTVGYPADSDLVARDSGIDPVDGS